MTEWKCVIEWDIDADTARQAATRAWWAVRSSTGPIVSVRPFGHSPATSTEIDLAEQPEADQAAPGETELLCDTCYEQQSGLFAECQDGCSKPLDHEGTCHGRSDEPQQCQRCGASDRLTAIDVA